MLEWRARLELGSESAAKLAEAMAELHALSTKLIACATTDQAVEAILDAAMSFHDAQFGLIQLTQLETGTLEAVAQRGLGEKFLAIFGSISLEDLCPSASAFRKKATLFVEDVERDLDYSPYVHAALEAGYRAVQVTPMICSEGIVVGVLSTFFSVPKMLDSTTVHVTELFAQQAADMILQLRGIEENLERQKLVAGELSHRVKNVLMMVIAVSRRTKNESTNLEDFENAFESRLGALAHAHDALQKADWKEASLNALLEEQLAAVNPNQVSFFGPNIFLKPDAVYILALVIYELGVNAHKYGALSTNGGRVRIQWEKHGQEDALVIDWSETDGPEVAIPAETGFGSSLIRNLIDSGLITCEFRYNPEGLNCRLRLPGSIAATAG